MLGKPNPIQFLSWVPVAANCGCEWHSGAIEGLLFCSSIRSFLLTGGCAIGGFMASSVRRSEAQSRGRIRAVSRRLVVLWPDQDFDLVNGLLFF